MNRLKELRLAHGFKSQKVLAATLFVNQTAVSQWERGITMPSGQMLVRLSELYGETIDYILGGDKEKQPPALSGELSDQERDVIRLVSELTEDQKEFLFAWIKTTIELRQQKPP